MAGLAENNFSAAFLAKLRDVHAHQRRQRAEVLYDIQRAETRLTELRRELAEVDAGIAESERMMRELGAGEQAKHIE